MRHSGVHGHCVGPKNGDAATLLGNRPHTHAWNCARSLERSISSLKLYGASGTRMSVLPICTKTSVPALVQA